MTDSNVPQKPITTTPKARPLGSAKPKETAPHPPENVRKALGRNPVPSFDEQHIRFCMESCDALFMVMVGIDGKISFSYNAATPAAMFALRQALEVAMEQVEMSPSTQPFKAFTTNGEDE